MCRRWLAILLGLAGLARAAETPALRELRVPFDEVRRLLAGSPNAVLLPREAYDSLREGARLRSRSPNPLQSAVLGSADCTIELREREATFAATLQLAVLADGAHLVPLRATGIDLLAATVDGKPAALWREGGALFLLVDGKGEHVAELAGLLPIETDAARQTLAFALPEATAMRLWVTAPGDVEVKAGAAVRSHAFDEGTDSTRLELVPTREPMQVVLSRNHRQRQAEAVVEARSVQFVSVGEYGEALQATVTVDIPHGSVRELAFRLPEGLSVTAVTGSDVARWSADQGRLSVAFRDDLTGSSTISIAGLRTGSPLGDWQFPVLRPLAVIGHSALLGVLLDDRLETRGTISAGLIAIPTALAADRLTLPSDGRQRLVAFLYGPRGDFAFAASIVKPPAAFRVGTNHLLTVADEGLALSSSFVISPEYERVFAVDVVLPLAWRVEEVRNEAGAVPFEVHPTGDENRVRVVFPTGAKLGENTSFTVVSRSVPKEWAEDWQERSLSFPAVQVVGAREDSGAVAVVGVNDFEVGATDLRGLVLLDQQERAAYGLQALSGGMTFRYAQPGYGLEVTVQRRTPRVTGETLSFFVVGQEKLRCHYELLYRVERARVRKVEFSLPLQTPVALAIGGLAGAQVKEYSSAEVDGQRQWTVWLESPVAGQVRLGVDCQVVLANEPEATLPMPILQGVVYQSGRLAVEGEPDLDVRVAEHPRPVDVGELAGMAYKPGPRLLGAFGFVDEPGPVRVTLTRHEGCSLPPVVVERIELTSVFGPSGAGQHLGTYVLRSKLRFLEIALPTGAELWSIQLDGEPLAPLREDGRLLFELPTADGAARRSLALVYETTGPALGLGGRLATAAPELVLRGDSGHSAAVPTADLSWRVYLPVGFRLSGSRGTVTAQGREAVVPGILQVAGLFVQACGGFGQGLFCTLSAPSPAARQAEMRAELMPRAAAENQACDVGLDRDQLGELPAQWEATQGFSQQATQAAYAQIGYVKPLKGARSLAIALTGQGPALTFRSLGERPQLAIRVLDGRRLRGICWGVAALVLAVGLYLNTRPVRKQVIYVGSVLVVAGLVPVLPGLVGLSLVLNYAFYAAVLLLVLDPCLRGWRRWAPRCLGRLVILQARTAVFLLVGLLAGSVLTGAEAPAAMEIVKPEPLALPLDALVVPYGEDGKLLPDVLVPRAHYEDLLNQLRPDDPPPPARPYGLGGVAYTCTLGEGERLTLQGQIELLAEGDDPVFVPLDLTDAVVASATLDGKPASLVLASLAPKTPPVVGLRVAGKGRHVLQCEVRVPVTSEGGWRRVKARLPSSGAATVSLRVPQAGTEVVRALAGSPRSHLTTKPNEEIKVPLSAAGELSLQWRPQTGVLVADPTLTAESDVLWQIQEDRLLLAWRAKLSFRRGERDRFSFSLPADYVVEAVTGGNVRAWEVRPEGLLQTVNVTTLKPAALQEEVVLALRRDGLGGAAQAQRVSLPALVVVGATRHTGRLQVRHSPLLDLRLAASDANVRRTERGEFPLPAFAGNASPLGVRDYATYELASLPCSLEIEVSTVALRPTVTIQSILRLSRREHALESRIELTRLLRPLYELRVVLPANLTVKDVHPSTPGEWYVATENGVPTLVILLPSGVEGSFWCSIDARLPEGLGEVSLPRLAVQGTSEPSGELVVQADPGLQVDPGSATGLDRVALASTFRWLKADQQPLARLAYRYAGGEWSGTCQVARRATEITAETVTNVRVSDRTVEETSLLSFRIDGGGVRELSFLLPSSQADATIECPLLRHKTVTPEGDGVRVVLALQDEVVGEVMVLVRADHARSGQELTVLPPSGLTGRITRQLLVAESAGRDEVIVDQQASVGLTPIVRNSENWAAASRLLGAGASEAFLVKPDEAAPRLALRVERRETVQTAGASIGLASTVLMMDDAGAFRGTQTFHLDNRTEPFLDIEIPDGAALWTAEVAGQQVKPVLMDATAPRRVSIPLVKTAEGDLDYTVVLKYGGHTDLPYLGGRLSFPVIRPLNLTPERSLLELRLPREHQWFRFGGTMGLVGGADDYQASYLAYQNVQAKRLVEALQSSNPFAQARAKSNLRRLKDSSVDLSGGDMWEAKEAVTKEREEVRQTIAQAERQVAEQEQVAQVDFNNDYIVRSFNQQNALRADQGIASIKNWAQEEARPTGDAFGQDKWYDGKSEAKAKSELGAVNWRQTQNRALVVQQDAAQSKPQSAAPEPAPQAPASVVLRGRTAFQVQDTNAPGTVFFDRLQSSVQDFAYTDDDGISDGEERVGLHVLSASSNRYQATGLASLDLEFPGEDPARWTTIRLATPRGDMQVTGRAVSRSLVLTLERLGSCLLVAVGLALLALLVVRIGQGFRRRRRLPLKALILLGLISMLFGILPALGLILLATLIVLAISGRHVRVPAA